MSRSPAEQRIASLRQQLVRLREQVRWYDSLLSLYDMSEPANVRIKRMRAELEELQRLEAEQESVAKKQRAEEQSRTPSAFEVMAAAMRESMSEHDVRVDSFTRTFSSAKTFTNGQRLTWSFTAHTKRYQYTATVADGVYDQSIVLSRDAVSIPLSATSFGPAVFPLAKDVPDRRVMLASELPLPSHVSAKLTGFRDDGVETPESVLLWRAFRTLMFERALELMSAHMIEFVASTQAANRDTVAENIKLFKRRFHANVRKFEFKSKDDTSTL